MVNSPEQPMRTSLRPLRVLVAGRAPVGSGIADKMSGIARALESAGCDVVLSLSADAGGTGSRSLRRGIRRPGFDVVYVRQDYALLPLLPWFLGRRLRGRKNVLDIPTPMSSAIHETEHLRSAPIRGLAKRVTQSLMAPFLWWTFGVLITYGPEMSGWARLGNARRIRLVGNGIDVNSRPIRRVPPPPGAKAPIRLLGIGVLHDAHGLDRLLLALSATDDGTAAPVEIIATGAASPTKTHIEALVQDLGLQASVQLREEVCGASMGQLFDWAHAGIGVLAPHRKGLEKLSALKHREYLARGLPFLYAGRDTALVGDEYFALQVPNDESPLELDPILAWVRRVSSGQSVANDCRDFALKHMTVEAQILPDVLNDTRRRR